MKSFWIVNKIISIIVFFMFLLYFVSIKFCLINSSVSNLIASTTFIFFMYGVFLELIQIPICIIGLFFKNKPKRVWLFFFMMVVFFIVKVILYIYLLGSGL
jgi:hypothetical protein